MNKFDYKNLSPFKWFVLENFPFIEADFDALTEWQLFCKLGKEINKIIDSQNLVGEQAETLTNAFNNLKNYVDNYFDNLDVQEEINNKLNDLVQDGTIERIINQEIFGELNAKVTNLENIQNPIGMYKGKNLVVLGDSWTAPTGTNSVNGRWVKLVSSKLSMIPFNYAVGGSAITRTNSYLNQINKAINEMSAEQKNNTPLVLIFGSDSDFEDNNTLQDYLKQCDTLYSTIENNFINAIIIHFAGEWRYNKLPNTISNKMDYYMENIVNYIQYKHKLKYIKNSQYWLFGENYYYQNQYHPNEYGYDYLASCILNVILNGSDIVRRTYSLNFSGINSINNNKSQVYGIYENGQVNIYGWLVLNTDINTSIFESNDDLSLCLIPEFEIFTNLYTAQGNICGFISFSPDNNGSIYIKINDGFNLKKEDLIRVGTIYYRTSANGELPFNS